MKIICRKCNVEISKQVKELDDLSLLNENDGKDYIPEGFFIVDKDEENIGTKGNIIINLKDLINSNYHPDESRLNGCCGNDGLDGLNRVCVNNHEIGTENSDCWMPHFIALEPHLVKLVNN
ncbi:hypothetical protein DCC39_05405 [Pueribacillus theae]|uniref:Uncharacterized protein n=1 Tax=Pueribacillus theae TaxID=2171751 RepID=A0A2U1K661_9BACI|nr:hypothetical protein [Pueribacillus theae]PWA12453.1 hypothetical protein DCC39_05405 [Pueribacillus theae]